MMPIRRILLCHTQSLERIEILAFLRRLVAQRSDALCGLRHLRLQLLQLLLQRLTLRLHRVSRARRRLGRR